MSDAPPAWRRLSLGDAAFYLAAGSAVAILFSIAVSHILLALAVVALLLSRVPLRFPPILIPLALFFAGTVVSMLLSVDPASGRPQIRKFFIWLIVLVVYSTARTMPRIEAIILASTGVVTLSAVWSFVQFYRKYERAEELGRSFYEYYTPERITGFMSHWMTIGGQEMIVGLMAAALALLCAGRRWRPWVFAALGVIGVSILLGFTRSIWLGSFAGGMYLIWVWRRWWTLALPALVLLLAIANPFAFRERVRSAFQPHGDTDSNAFRAVCRRTGIRMIAAHPWFGLGPEQVKAQFMQYLPPDTPRPLPTGWYGHLHNIYLHYAAERGIPTAVALFWLLGKVAFDIARALRRARGEPRAILHGALAVFIGVLLVGYFELNLGDTEAVTPFLVVIACAYAAIDIDRAQLPRCMTQNV